MIVFELQESMHESPEFAVTSGIFLPVKHELLSESRQIQKVSERKNAGYVQFGFMLQLSEIKTQDF